jgi:hypothetical protein
VLPVEHEDLEFLLGQVPDSSSASAVSVSFTNRRETADRPVDVAPSTTALPMGSAIRAGRRVATCH